MANEKAINRLVNVVFGTTGAEGAASAIGSVNNSLNNLDKSSKSSAKGLGIVSGGFKHAADSATKFAAVGYAIKQVFGNLGINTSQKELANYNKEILKSSAQFSKYGESIFQVEKRILKVKNSFGLTRQEAIRLQSTFEKGFNYQNPNKMISVMETLYSIVGSNAEAMQEMVQSASAVGQVIPIYQELFNIGMSSQTAKAAVNARKTSKELLYAAALSGKISIGDFKTQLESIAALENKSSAQTGATKERQKQIENLAKLKVLWEDITLTVATHLTPWVSRLNNMLQSGGEKLIKWAAYAAAAAAGVAAIVSVVGVANAAMSVANFATGSGLISGSGKAGRMGAIGSVMSDHGSSFARPTFVYVVGGMPLNGRSPVIMGGGKAGKAGKLGRLGKLGNAAKVGGIVALLSGIASQFATNSAQSTFATPEKLSKSGKYEFAGRQVGTLATGAAAGAIVGAGAGLVGGPLAAVTVPFGAAVGAITGTLVASFDMITTSSYSLSKGMVESRNNMNKHYDEMIKNAKTQEQEIYLKTIQEKNNLQNKAGDLEGKNSNVWRGTFGNTKVGNWFGESDKKISDIKKQASDLNDQLIELSENSENSLNLKEQNRQLLNVTSKLKLVEDYVEAINSKYDSSISKLKSIADVVKLTAGQGGGLGFAGAIGEATKAQDEKVLASQMKYDSIKKIIDQDFTKNIDFDVGNEKDVLKQLKESLGTSLSEVDLQKLSTSVGRGQMQLMLETMLNKAKAEQNQALSGYAEISEMIVESGRGAQELAKSNTARIDADIALASNLAAGVSVSAQMRMENVQAIQQEIVAIENMISLAQGELNKAKQSISTASTEEELNAALAQKIKMEQKVNGLVVERTQAMTKQAELTKVMRDGYIDAIAAMTTGAGMFTQITIDQNKNLGQLAAGTNNRVVGLRSGAMARGFTSSERYSAGGIMSNGSRFGGSDEVNKLITSSNPLASFNNVAGDIGESVSSAGSQLIQTWQDEAGRFFSNMSAAMKDQRYGTSELQDKIKSGGASRHSPTSSVGQSSSSTVGDILNGYGPAPASRSVSFSATERNDLVNSLSKEFTGLVIRALNMSEAAIMDNFKEMG